MDTLVTENILESYLKWVAAAALFVSTGILILNGSRDLFEVDPKQRSVPSLIGGVPLLIWEYRLMSDAAQDGRLELKQIADILRFAIFTIISIVVVFFFVQGITNFADYFLTGGTSELAVRVNAYLRGTLIYIMLVLLSGFTVILVYQLASMIHHVVEAHIRFRDNK